MISWLKVLLVFITTNSLQNSLVLFSASVAASETDKTIVVLLDLRRESECNGVENYVAIEAMEVGRQRAEAAQWTFQRIKNSLDNQQTSLSGLRIVDTCGNIQFTSSRILSLAAEYNLINFIANKNDVGNNTVASKSQNLPQNFDGTSGYILLSSFVEDQVIHSLDLVGLASKPLLSGLYKPPQEPLFEEQDALLAMIKRLRWKYIILIVEHLQPFVTEAFSDATAKEDICITLNINVNTNKTTDLSDVNNVQRIKEVLKTAPSRNIVLLSSRNPSYVIDVLNDTFTRDFNWILSRPDSSEEIVLSAVTSTSLSSINTMDYSNNATTGAIYVMQNEFLRVPEFIEHYRNLSSHTSKSSEDPNLMQLIRSLLGLSNLVESANGDCCNLTLPTEDQTRDVLGLSFQERRINALMMSSTQEIVTLGHYMHQGGGLQLEPQFEDVVLPGQQDEENQCSQNCKCQNLKIVPADQLLKWRFDTWVTIMATLSSLGLLTSICLTFFLACKLCTQVLEASQTTSFLLLFAIMFAYICFIPYGLEPTETVCPLRSIATRLAFVFIFAILLSRSIMLATADLDGLPGHISGCLQFVLFLFMVTTEVALVLEEWFSKTKDDFTSDQDKELAFTIRIIDKGKYEKLECRENGFLVRLAYAVALLFLQLCLSPFILRSGRNYKEGLLFSCGAISCFFVWVGWITAYILFKEDMVLKDITVCCGLIATPTVLILVVFIPKCYLMTSSSLYKEHHHTADVSLQGLGGHCTNSVQLSRSASSCLSHIDLGTENGAGHATIMTTATDDLAINNSLAAIGSTRNLYNSQKSHGSSKSSRQPLTSLHPEGNGGFEVQQQQPPQPLLMQPQSLSYRSSLYGINIGGGYKSNVGYNKSRQLPQFLAAGLPCDSPEHRAIASEYPTYKLDQNTVVDNSISWERCNPDGAVNCVPNGAGGPTCNNTSQISLSNRFV